MTPRKREKELAEKLSVSISRAISPESLPTTDDRDKEEKEQVENKPTGEITASDIEKLIKKKK